MSMIVSSSLLLLVGMTALLGCSSQSGSTPMTMTAVDGIWETKGTAKFGVFLSSFPNQCARKQASTGTASSTIVEIDITAPAGQATVPAGTYQVLGDDAPGVATAQHKVRDASCNDTKVDATSGSVTFTTSVGGADSSTVSGSYSIQFEDGANVSGNFATAGFRDPSVMTAAGPACVQ